jgi:hypothetical protein
MKRTGLVMSYKIRVYKSAFGDYVISKNPEAIETVGPTITNTPAEADVGFLLDQLCGMNFGERDRRQYRFWKEETLCVAMATCNSLLVDGEYEKARVI